MERRGISFSLWYHIETVNTHWRGSRLCLTPAFSPEQVPELVILPIYSTLPSEMQSRPMPLLTLAAGTLFAPHFVGMKVSGFRPIMLLQNETFWLGVKE